MNIENPIPKDLYFHQFCFSMNYGKNSQTVWETLQKRETFCRGQLPPWRVVFESGKTSGTFEKGELSIHHGPMLSAHGVIAEISDNYRDLVYGYGSYAISYRLIRPYQLQFFKHGDVIELKFDVYTPKWFRPLWKTLSFVFWPQFFLNLKLVGWIKSFSKSST